MKKDYETVTVYWSSAKPSDRVAISHLAQTHKACCVSSHSISGSKYGGNQSHTNETYEVPSDRASSFQKQTIAL